VATKSSSEHNQTEPRDLVAYVPAINRGYLDLFEEFTGNAMHIVDQDILDHLPHLRKDVRAFSPETAHQIVDRLGYFSTVSLIDYDGLADIQSKTIAAPDDEVTDFIETLLPDRVEVKRRPVFLRWDRARSSEHKNIEPDHVITVDELEPGLFEVIEAVIDDSTDWWRQVGACVQTANLQQIARANEHLPTEYSPAIDGDPRLHGKKGTGRDMTTAIHAETSVIAEAARTGVNLEGSKMLVTTFPCPTCAKSIAASGISRVYYIEGYAMVDGDKVLRDAEVEIIKVDLQSTQESSRLAPRPYPEK